MPATILYAYKRKSTFVEIDLEALRERWEVREWRQEGARVNLLRLARAVREADLVFGWFAAWATLWPTTLAWLLRKPSVVVIGGFDVVKRPDIGLGSQRGGARKWMSRWIIARASRLITNSYSSRAEAEANVGLPPERVSVVHHGVGDPYGDMPGGERERVAVTVGDVLLDNLERKGHRPFVEAAHLLPDVRFVLVGKWHDEAIEVLRARAPANVTFTGWVSQEELNDLLARAAVYVQPSQHEGFGLSVAEAMVAGCIPVVTATTALPEVVGPVGVQVPTSRPDDVAQGVREALAMGDEQRRRVRERALTEFSLERRAEGISAVVSAALGDGRTPRAAGARGNAFARR